MLADYHIHTEFSDDSVYPMEDVIRDAVQMGMEEICITDHVDYGVKKDWDQVEISYRMGEPIANVDYPRYMEKIQQMKENWGDKIRIRIGMEFGVQRHTVPEFESLFQRYPFDFIILSIHQVEDKEFWTQDFQRGKPQEEYNLGYYEELLAVIKKYKNYSVLGHMDLIARYDEAGIYPFEKIKPIVEKILRIVIAEGKGIEINTSSHRYGLQDTMPSTDILKLYRDLGGKILTIGSDSHRPEQLGAYIKETKELLRNLRFRYFCTYEGMSHIYHSL